MSSPAAGTAPAATPSPATANRALRGPDAGEPLVRQLLRDVPGRRRHSAGHLHADRPVAPGRALRAPVPAGDSGGPDLPHDARVHRAQLAHGEMDGFVRAASSGRQRPELGVMAPLHRPRPALLLERRRRVRPVRPLVRRRAGRQRAEPAVLGERHSRRGRRQRPRGGFGALPTIFDRLERRGVSWKFYVEDYDPRRSFAWRSRRHERSGGPRAAPQLCPLRREPEPPPPHRRSRRVLRRRAGGTLPAVAYIAPGGSSEHPPRPPEAGQTLVRTLLTALARSSAWPQLRVHLDLRRVGWLVRPRAPAPGARLQGAGAAGQPLRARGRVDSTVLDHTSILRFIEDNWGVAPLTRARRAGQWARERLRLRKPAAQGGDHRGHSRRR